MNAVRIGTRGSALALAQARWVAQRLQSAHPGLHVELVTIRTTGDMRRGVPVAQVGTKGMFVKEIEDALLNGDVDVAVHSLKDLPGSLPDGLVLAAVPPRADPRDALVAPDRTLETLPAGSCVGTSSLRRRAMLMAARPDLRVQELRGNLDTRLRKLKEGRYDGLLLACAGLDRLGMAGYISQRLPLHLFLPAPGQGFLGLECREDRPELRTLVEPLSDREAFLCASAERAFQRALGAGCSIPAGACAQIGENMLTLEVVLIAPDASIIFRQKEWGAPSQAEAIGERAAHAILERAGAELLTSAFNDGQLGTAEELEE